MDLKRIFRGPWLWIVIAVVGVLVALQYLAPNGGYDEIDTSTMVEHIDQGEVEKLLFIDEDQEIRATLTDGKKVVAHWLDGTQARDLRGCRQGPGRGHSEGLQREGAAAVVPRFAAGHVPAVPADHLAVPLPDEPGPGWRRPGHAVRQVQSQADQQGHAEDDVRRRRRLPGSDRGARRDQGVPAGARQVPGRRRQDPQGCAALRPAWHRQDTARSCSGRRGRRAVLLDLGLRLRRDVRRCRCLASPRPVRAGQGERPGHRLHRRDRRCGSSPWRGNGWRSRRARADAQPAARRDGRLRRAWRRDPDRGHQPSRHPRPCAAAPGPLRPPDRRGRT